MEIHASIRSFQSESERSCDGDAHCLLPCDRAVADSVLVRTSAMPPYPGSLDNASPGAEHTHGWSGSRCEPQREPHCTTAPEPTKLVRKPVTLATKSISFSKQFLKDLTGSVSFLANRFEIR